LILNDLKAGRDVFNIEKPPSMSAIHIDDIEDVIESNKQV
jgi:hypothetical protein